MELTKETIISMAVAVIAEEMGEDIKSLRVLSFREAPCSSLERYIIDHNINYTKYQLEA